MTFTYVPTDDIGKVRRKTGQTISAEAEISDEEIEAWLADEGNDTDRAAVRILRQLAAKYAGRASITSGNEKIENGSVSKNYRDMAADLENSLGVSGSRLTNRRVNRR